MESGSFHRKGITGSFPQYGAIFMADNFTRKECFSRNLFGLPSRFADFVMEIKTGMLLFLFDYQDRKLYGVFEASSDGAINIEPHAYKSSGKQFPAQVRFNIIWRCAPLPEDAFRREIQENYFATNKFRFGLSKDQVQRLLFLFEERKVKNRRIEQRWQCQISRHIMSPVVGSQPKSIDSSVTLPESIIQKGHSLGVSGHGYNTDPEDSISLTSKGPLVECQSTAIDDSESLPESVQQTSLDVSDHGIASDIQDFIPLPSVDPEEIKNLQFSTSLFSEVDEYLQNICSSLPLSNDKQEADKLIGGSGSGGHQVRGLYSDSSKNRTSVFLRLAGASNAIAEEKSHRHSRSKMDKSKESYKLRRKTESRKTPPRHEPNALKKRVGVFSRLNYNTGKLPKPGGEEVLKRKRSETVVQNEPRVKSVIAENEEKVDSRSRKQQKRNISSESLLETKQTHDNHSSVLVLSQGSSGSTINSEGFEPSCKSNLVDYSDSNSPKDKSPPKTHSFVCEDDQKSSEEGSADVQLNSDSLNDPDKSCTEDAVKKPSMTTYQQSLPGSPTAEDLAERVSVGMVEADANLKSCTSTGGERELDFISLDCC